MCLFRLYGSLISFISFVTVFWYGSLVFLVSVLLKWLTSISCFWYRHLVRSIKLFLVFFIGTLNKCVFV